MQLHSRPVPSSHSTITNTNIKTSSSSCFELVSSQGPHFYVSTRAFSSRLSLPPFLPFPRQREHFRMPSPLPKPETPLGRLAWLWV